MKKIIPILTMSILAGCGSLQGLTGLTYSYDKLDEHMNNQPTLSTPKDQLMYVNLQCFSDFHDSGFFEDNISYSFQGFLADGVYSENYYKWDKKREHKTKDEYNDIDSIMNDDVEGSVFNFTMEEDSNGEYIASAQLTKRSFIENKVINKNKVNVFKHIDHSLEYYPINKKPTKIYDDKVEVCYVTVSW